MAFDTLPRRSRLLARAEHHPVRATVRKQLHAAADPVPLDELARVLDVAIGIVRYHVRVLVACGLAELDLKGLARSRT